MTTEKIRTRKIKIDGLLIVLKIPRFICDGESEEEISGAFMQILEHKHQRRHYRPEDSTQKVIVPGVNSFRAISTAFGCSMEETSTRLLSLITASINARSKALSGSCAMPRPEVRKNAFGSRLLFVI